MFPLNWNIPFIRKNGSRTTLGAITGDIAGIEEDVAGLIDNANANGAVNELEVNLTKIKEYNASGWTVSNNTFSRANTTFTINDDGTISVTTSGTASSSSQLILQTNVNFGASGISTTSNGVSDNGSYKIQGTPSAYYNNDNLRLQYVKSSNQVVLYVKNGASISNAKVYPMIVRSSYPLTGNIEVDYVPYAMTNRELTEDTITQTDVTFTPDTAKVTVINANLYREGKHIRGRLDLKVVDTAGGTLGTFNKTAAYITPMYAYVGDRTTIDNQPAYSYVNGTSLVINPVSAFVANDRIQVAIDYYIA